MVAMTYRFAESVFNSMAGWYTKFIDSVTGTKKDKWLYQKCRCMEEEDLKKGKTIDPWLDFDYNQSVEFCYCCSRELINCGLKYSWFYCTDCKKMVEDYNRHSLALQIPLGRHSFLNGLMLQVPYTDKEEALFKIRLDIFIGRIEKIREWKKLWLFENPHDLEFNFKKDIDLPLYRPRNE
jgi:hypothetical protein